MPIYGNPHQIFKQKRKDLQVVNIMTNSNFQITTREYKLMPISKDSKREKME